MTETQEGTRLPFHRQPYIITGDPVDDAVSSAQIDLEEADTLDRDDPMVGYLQGSADRWRQQAREAREQVAAQRDAEHRAFHDRSELPLPSPLCAHCDPTGDCYREVPDL